MFQPFVTPPWFDNPVETTAFNCFIMEQENENENENEEEDDDDGFLVW